MRLLPAIAALLLPLAAAAQPPTKPPGAAVELNRLEPRAEGCRIWLALRNPTPQAHDKVRLDLVLFAPDGIVARRMVVDAGALPAEKTMVRIFDTAGLPCDGIGTMLLNDIPTCGAEPCLPLFATTSRVPGVALER
jgi:hypothetical protein